MGEEKEKIERLEAYIQQMAPLSQKVMEQAKKRTDALMKPLGSLGKLEDVAIQIAGITGRVENAFPARCTIVMASDNGICREGVASAPVEITRIQTENMARGLTGISALSENEGADVLVVDVGIDGRCENLDERTGDLMEASLLRAMREKKVVWGKIRPGTDSFRQGPAMTREEALKAVETGIRITEALIRAGYGLLGTGEMGIGNTSSSAALISVLCGALPERTVGRGAGLTEEAYRHKIRVITQGIQNNGLAVQEGKRMVYTGVEQVIQVLHKVGGLDLCALTGCYLAAAKNRTPIVVDGVISIAAAAAAYCMAPLSKEYMIASHRSAEPAYQAAAAVLGLHPCLDLDMRLGEGTGCPLMFGLIRAACACQSRIASFEEMQVSGDFLVDNR